MLCFLLSANTGEVPSSKGLELLAISLSDSLTTSSGKFNTANEPLVEKAA
ncbi:hypothetical protein MtrunA17_Chr7g0261211 [Medicago truncatula]|uniref:Uncharacterized protein n=1 Tax=Medicago truncatula TaxID=3880 RepID=A0A396H4J3_MEDTR|nr:hypothetical protein MtrunA17_Chr7g0261211 [Medicago truncatula]